jgi:hypothetical protein
VYPIKCTSFTRFFLCFLASFGSSFHGSISGKSSKILVSSACFNFGIFGAVLSLILSQPTPLKNGCAFISSTPFTPNRSLGSHINLFSRSVAGALSLASFGIKNVFFQSRTFLHVALGFSAKNGGYPTNISNSIAPNDHQSTVSV